MTHACPSCGKTYTQYLPDMWVIVCSSCRAKVVGANEVRLIEGPMHDDWCPIQIGTTGEYQKKPFRIVGRLRLQFKNDFRNLWCAHYNNGSMWIDQSLECIRFFPGSFTVFPVDIKNLRANDMIELTGHVKLKCDFVQHVDYYQIEGEISRFPFISNPPRIAEAGNPGNAALLVINGNGPDEFLWGELFSSLNYPFQNVKTWDEWK